jgi:hypothetical protein
VAAHKVVQPRKREAYQRILEIARICGPEGITVHSIASAMSTTPNCVSGRLSEMRFLGMLDYALDQAGNKRKRGGACVLVLPTVEQQAQ